MKPINLKIIWALVCLCLLSPLSALAQTKERTYAVPKKEFNISYPISFKSQKIYPGNVYPLHWRTDKHFFIEYNFDGEKHIVRIPRVNSTGKPTAKPRNNEIEILQLLQSDFKKGYINFDPRSPLPIVKETETQLKIGVKKAGKVGVMRLPKKYFLITDTLPKRRDELSSNESIIEIEMR